MRIRSSLRLILARGFPFSSHAPLAVKACTRHTHGTRRHRVLTGRAIRAWETVSCLAIADVATHILSRMRVDDTSRVYNRDDNASSLKTLARFLASRNVQADAWVAKNYDCRCEMHEFLLQLTTVDCSCQRILSYLSCVANFYVIGMYWTNDPMKLWTLVLWKTCKLYIVWNYTLLNIKVLNKGNICAATHNWNHPSSMFNKLCNYLIIISRFIDNY